MAIVTLTPSGKGGIARVVHDQDQDDPAPTGEATTRTPIARPNAAAATVV
jgi:hypothetical protein